MARTPPARWQYSDHAGMWRDELADWFPDTFFDGHVHLGPPQVMGVITAERQREPLTTFSDLTWEQYTRVSADLFLGRQRLGLFAFPFPLREVDLSGANDYIIDLMQTVPNVYGFALADPAKAAPTISVCERAHERGVPFTGVKPYADLTGRSNFGTTMPEFIPEALLEFMNAEGLALMLHTSGTGMDEAHNRAYVGRVAETYSGIKVILAHMGRYIDAQKCCEFLGSGFLENHPNVFLDMSSVSVPVVYETLLEREALWSRLMFATDLPFGLITGVERWSETHGAVFISRDDYEWSDPAMQTRYAEERRSLTYNTYHCIQALRQAFENVGLAGQQATGLKQAIFSGNVLREILGEVLPTDA